MGLSSDPGKPLVERNPESEAPKDLTERALRQRIRQQELLAELGVLAVQGTDFIGMLNNTARMTAEGLGAEFCKVMEYVPAENRLSGSAPIGTPACRGLSRLDQRLMQRSAGVPFRV